jgi:hypothetical protein
MGATIQRPMGWNISSSVSLASPCYTSLFTGSKTRRRQIVLHCRDSIRAQAIWRYGASSHDYKSPETAHEYSKSAPATRVTASSSLVVIGDLSLSFRHKVE